MDENRSIMSERNAAENSVNSHFLSAPIMVVTTTKLKLSLVVMFGHMGWSVLRNQIGSGLDFEPLKCSAFQRFAEKL